jgi:glycosyltransferase involved in cell wall biosynthesis
MKISVITISLNSREHIADTLASIHDQNYSNFEHIIVDGGSSDGTIDIVKTFAASNDHLVFVSEPDKGISDAMNKGLALATGDVVAFLHSDDYYAGEYVLSTVAAAFKESSEQSLWATGGIVEVDTQGITIRSLSARKFTKRRLLRNNIIYHPATFVRRETLLQLRGFDQGLRYAMDYDLWLRLSLIALPVQIAESIACFRVHSGSISSQNRIAALNEEYYVRMRYVNGWGRCWHWFYQLLRRFGEQLRFQRK